MRARGLSPSARAERWGGALRGGGWDLEWEVVGWGMGESEDVEEVDGDDMLSSSRTGRVMSNRSIALEI